MQTVNTLIKRNFIDAHRQAITRVYVWSIPLLPWIQLLKIDYRGKLVKNVKGLLSGKIKKATSNFILIV